MIISWINKFSLIEYPEQISCIIFTPWCNFRCWFCHNSEYVLPSKIKNISIIPEKAVLNFLEIRKWLLTWVSICWWEPTIHKDLPNFCEKVKTMWYKVKLDTNWQNPNMLRMLLENKLIDYIAMDIKNPIWDFSSIANVKLDEKLYLETIDLIKNSNIKYEFRTTVIKGIHSVKNIEDIAKYISWAQNYNLQNYKAWDTLDKNFKWESFTDDELEELKIVASKYINKVEIKN